jgi:hypothetical protein
VQIEIARALPLSKEKHKGPAGDEQLEFCSRIAFFNSYWAVLEMDMPVLKKNKVL